MNSKDLYTGAGIYQFTCNITGMKYVGKSKECKKRYGAHIATSRKITSKIIITGGDFEYNILEKLPLDVSDELLADREQYWMEQVPSEFLLNINRAKYLGHKAHYIEHKYKIDARMAAYHAAHKDEINARRAEKIECDCGSTYRRVDKSRHLKTKKHNDFINNKI